MSNLKTTSVYSLDVTEIKDTNGEQGLGYRVTNLRTDVHEYETFMLAEALAFFEQTEALVQDFFSEKEADKALHS